ncbi:hypothetical protein [Paraburkholderia phenazinium]|uniref:hypothetical protein n=1 Tax=Paraburkholderia phenazinium TaxID=60549 RepID=UPI00115FED20|nr:hypothetical protein [Paraburkholderia phenazinium]
MTLTRKFRTVVIEGCDFEVRDDSGTFLSQLRGICTISELSKVLFDSRNRLFLLKQQEARQCANAAAGVLVEEDGVFLFGESGADLPPIEDFLPYAAKRSVRPFLADSIPETSWGSSLSNLLTWPCWNRLRQSAFVATGHRCLLCGAGEKLDCHEIWKYYEPSEHGQLHRGALCGVQRLVKLIPVCPDCHETFHLGLARIRGRLDITLERIAALYRLSDDERDAYLAMVKEDWYRRNEFSWALDVSAVGASLLEIKPEWKLHPDGSLSAKQKYGTSHTFVLGAPWRRKGDREERLISIEAFLRGSAHQKIPSTHGHRD